MHRSLPNAQRIDYVTTHSAFKAPAAACELVANSCVEPSRYKSIITTSRIWEHSQQWCQLHECARIRRRQRLWQHKGETEVSRTAKEGIDEDMAAASSQSPYSSYYHRVVVEASIFGQVKSALYAMRRASAPISIEMSAMPAATATGRHNQARERQA